MIFHHRAKDLCQPEWSVNHVKTPIEFKHFCALPDYIVKCTPDLVACYRHGIVCIFDTVLTYHIRRIYRHHLHGLSTENLRCIAHISLFYGHFVLKMVIFHTSFRQVSTLRLKLESAVMLSVILCLKKYRNHTVSGAQIHSSLAALYLCIVR